jgi:hypothetical protein
VRCRSVIATSNNVAITDYEDQLTLVIIVERSEYDKENPRLQYNMAPGRAQICPEILVNA